MAIYLGRKPCLCADCFNSGWFFIVAEVRIINFEIPLFKRAVISIQFDEGNP